MKKIKILAFLSALGLLVQANSGIIGAMETNDKKVKTKTYKNSQISFSERHPSITKAFYFIVTMSGIAGFYYGGSYVLDKIDPERIKERENYKKYKTELENIRKSILNFKFKNPGKEIVDFDTRKNEEFLKGLITKEEWLTKKLESGGLFGSLKDKIIGIAVIGGIIDLAKGLVGLVNSFGEFCRNIQYISWMRWAGENFFEIFRFLASYFKSPPKETSKEDALESLDTLFDGIYGQDDAIRQLRNHLIDIITAKDQTKFTGIKDPNVNLIYLYGPSRVGKSLAAMKIPEVLLSRGDIFVLSSSDVNPDDKNKSVFEQLFSYGNQTSDSVQTTRRPLIEYLKNGGKVVIIEEYDKFCNPAIDEIFRGAHNHGYITIDGEKINVEGLTVIFTSNEDDISMQGFDKENVESLDKKDIKDGRTRVWHTPSFLRILRKIRFANLTAKYYKPIIKKNFDLISSYWKSPINGGIIIDLEENSIDFLAERVEKKEQGTTPIKEWIIPGIQSVIMTKLKEIREELDSLSINEYFEDKTLEIVYDAQDEKFEINERPKDANIVQ